MTVKQNSDVHQKHSFNNSSLKIVIAVFSVFLWKILLSSILCERVLKTLQVDIKRGSLENALYGYMNIFPLILKFIKKFGKCVSQYSMKYSDTFAMP